VDRRSWGRTCSIGPSGAVVGSAGSSTVWVSTDRFAKWRSVTLPAPFLAASGYAPGLAGNAAVPTSIGVNNASLVWIVAGPLPAGSGSPDGSAGSVGLFELDPLTATLTYQGDLLGAGWASGARLSSVRVAPWSKRPWCQLSLRQGTHVITFGRYDHRP